MLLKHNLLIYSYFFPIYFSSLSNKITSISHEETTCSTMKLGLSVLDVNVAPPISQSIIHFLISKYFTISTYVCIPFLHLFSQLSFNSFYYSLLY